MGLLGIYNKLISLRKSSNLKIQVILEYLKYDEVTSSRVNKYLFMKSSVFILVRKNRDFFHSE